MPDEKKKIRLPDGNEVQAEQVGFAAQTEPWSEYLLDDGSVLRVRLVTTQVLRLDGVYDPAGNPLYLINSQNVAVASSPEKLRQKKDKGK